MQCEFKVQAFAHSPDAVSSHIKTPAPKSQSKPNAPEEKFVPFKQTQELEKGSTSFAG